MHGSSVTRTGFASTSEVWTFSAWEYAKLRDSKVCRGRHLQFYDLRTELKKNPLIVSKVVGTQTEGQTEWYHKRQFHCN
jgi:hypothetical protein